jgi:hypothetical protein
MQFIEIFNAHSAATARCLQQFPHASVPPPPPVLLQLVGKTISLANDDYSLKSETRNRSSRGDSAGQDSPVKQQHQQQQQQQQQSTDFGPVPFSASSIHSSGNEGAALSQILMVCTIMTTIVGVVSKVKQRPRCFVRRNTKCSSYRRR